MKTTQKQACIQIFQGKDYNSFIRAAKKFMLRYGADSQLYVLVGIAYFHLGMLDKSYRYAEKGAILNPAETQAYIVMMEASLKYDDCQITLEKLRNLIQKYGRFLSPLFAQEILDIAAFIYISFLGDSKNCLECIAKTMDYATDLADKRRIYSTYLGALNYPSDLSQRSIGAACARYNDFFADITPYIIPPYTKPMKLRIGYVSPDFRHHVVTNFIYKILKYHNKGDFEITCYYTNDIHDEVTAQLKVFADHWVQIAHLSPEEAAEKIHADAIDILVDLAGHTRKSGLPVFAYRPAPIQISGIGYWNTTGLNTMDYFLTDVYCDPPEQEDHAYFSETLLRLPHSHLCYTPPSIIPEPNELPCKKNGFITFGSFNNFAKVTDEVLLLWRSILCRLDNSKLILKIRASERYNFERNIIARLKNLGFDEGQFALRRYHFPYLQEYQEIDIALDTFPYPGGGTTCEALCMGVPVITMCGKRHGARFGYSILKNIGLDECIAHNKDEYANIAVALSEDLAHLQKLRQNLRAQIYASPVMDGEAYTRDLESIYKEVWKKKVLCQ